jgi:hypothetical protein
MSNLQNSTGSVFKSYKTAFTWKTTEEIFDNSMTIGICAILIFDQEKK